MLDHVAGPEVIVHSPTRLSALLAPFSLAAFLSACLSACPEATEPLSPEDEARRLGDPETPLTADIDVDTNRDGAIDAFDDADENDFNAAHGAVFFANVDDDDNDGERDRDDDEIDTDEDLLDFTTVRVRGVIDLDGETVTLKVDPPIARERIRIWKPTRSSHEIIFDPNDAPESIDIDDAGEDQELLIEALTPRTRDWDGLLTLTLTVSDGHDVLSEDSVELRVSPLIFPDNLQTPRVLFVMDLPFGQDNNQAFVDAMRDAIPDSVDLYTLDDNAYSGDRWVQDNMELGYQMKTGPDGSTIEMKTAMQLERSNGYGAGLENFVPYEFLQHSQGFLYPGGTPTSHNYGGNLEVAPPVDGFPLGRMLFGGGSQGTILGRSYSDSMNDNQVDFLDAQEIQGPALQLSSEWLAVGHIDEIFQFVPDLTPDAGGHAFKVIIASPRVARDALIATQSRGGGSLSVFEGRDAPYTVDEVLGAESFMALNEATQARLDAIQAKMKAELGLTDDDFRAVPVLYEEVGNGLLAAFNPGVQNLVTIGDRVFAPDPEGPHEAGADVWREATRAALADTDLDVVFVDVFFSYHRLLGEAHCGTNVDREPYSQAWWTVQ